MASYTTEFKVGLLTIFATTATIWGIVRTDDRPDGALDGYRLVAYFPSVEGVFPTTQVKIAGVSVGSVRKVELEGDVAKVTLEMSGNIHLADDSMGELKGEGVLGDKFIRVTPGRSDRLLQEGETLKSAPPAKGLDDIQAQVADIAVNAAAITESIRSMVEDPVLRDSMTRTVTNVEMLSADLRTITNANREDLEIIAKNLVELSNTLNGLVNRTGDDVESEMATIRSMTQKLDGTLTHVNALAERIDNGEGTIGQLINDTSTIDSLNSTLGKVESTVDSITGLKTQVYYDGAVYLGTAPDELGFTENPVSGSSKSTIGLIISPRDDYSYIFGFTGHPLGSFSSEEHLYSETGTSYTEVVRDEDFRLTFQFSKRWKNVAARLGVKESSGGVGLDVFLARDRLKLSADIYDFTYASWPVLDGTPNLTLAARVSPWDRVYVSAGWENAIFGLRHGFTTGFVGAGFAFTDDDIKWVFAALPFPG